MKCRKCHKVIDEKPTKIGFRDQCPHCFTDLHSCVNCKHHVPHLHNECFIPDTEIIRDREAMNFCEYFVAKQDSAPKAPESKNDLDERLKSLFKNSP